MMMLVLIAYLAGLLTILSPCILPVLPFVFARAQQSFLKSGLPLLAGMILTFALFSSLALIGGEFLTQANGFGRVSALALFTVLGVSLIFPQIQETLFSPLAKIGAKVGYGMNRDSGMGAFFIGIGTGLLWAPCAGPILGLVLTGAAAQGQLGRSFGFLLAYALGAATSLALALLAGKRVFGIMKKTLGLDRLIRQTLGVAVLIGVAVIAFGLDRTVLTQISKFETVNIENKLLAAAGFAKKSVEGETPEIDGATLWLNSAPLAKKDLKGKVVLIDFWTYSCINCLRTLPYVKAWSEKFKNNDFMVIGIHTPEFAFEKNADNVKKAVAELGLDYPIALDNDFKIWNAFANQYWPAHYFIDREGRIRHAHFGEGEYDQSEQWIRDLLAEGGHAVQEASTVAKAEGRQAGSNIEETSPETYLGYERAENFASLPLMVKDQTTSYGLPSKLKADQWAFSGQWRVEGERSVTKQKKAKLTYRFYGRDLHLVLGAATQPVKFKVTLDGRSPGSDHGLDIDGEGQGQIREQRLYQLIRLKNPGQQHVFEIEFADPGAEVYAFTFG